MKIIILIVTLFSISISQQRDSIQQKEAEAICAERGHDTFGSVGTSTLMWCPPYTVDLPDKTLLITPNCNMITCICRRCGKQIISGGKADTTIIWERRQK